MKIDRRFEEALGVGPRFIMKGVYAHYFGFKREVSTEINLLIVRRPKRKPCVCMVSYASDRWNRIRVLFSSFGFIGTNRNKPLQNNKQYRKEKGQENKVITTRNE